MGASQRFNSAQGGFFDKFSIEDSPINTTLSPQVDNGCLEEKKAVNEFSEIVGVDFGHGNMCCHFLKHGIDLENIPYKKAIGFLIDETPENCLVVAESAHLGNRRTVDSLAQLFTEEELATLNDGLSRGSKTLALFPQSATRRVGRWVFRNAPEGFVTEDKTTDVNDARILAYYVGHKNDLSLMSPVSSFVLTKACIYGRLARRHANRVLGPARSLGYAVGELFPVTSRLAEELYRRLSPTKPVLGDSLSISLGVLATVVFERPAIASNGESSIASVSTYKGRVPGYRFWKKNVLMMSPWHHKAGILRSNLMHHRYHSMLKSTLGLRGHSRLDFAEFSDEQHRIKREFSRAFRHDLKALYLSAVDMATESGLPHKELLEAAP